MYIYIYTYICIYIYTYTYLECKCTYPLGGTHMVGFHDFNLRIFNLRVSNPNKLIVDVFVDTMSAFNAPGSRPKKTIKFRKSTVRHRACHYDIVHMHCRTHISIYTVYALYTLYTLEYCRARLLGARPAPSECAPPKLCPQV